MNLAASMAEYTNGDERGELGGHTLPASQARMNVVQKIDHHGEVNRARYMPQKSDLIAKAWISGTSYRE